MKNNKKIILAILLIFISIIISACFEERKNENKPWNLILKDGLLYKDSLATIPYTGHYKGKVMGKKIEYDVVNGKKHGIFALYHRNGDVETYGYMIENKNHGEWRYYYPNGILESVGMFKYNKLDSVWNWYYRTGKLMQVGEFNEGKKEGEWKFYDNFGNLRLVMKYKNDELKDSVVYEVSKTSDTLVIQKDSLITQ